MANYASLKAAIQQVIKTNGNNEITGALLQQSLISMINSLGANYQFVGVANPTTNPGTPDQNVFYIAISPGVYSNFSATEISFGEFGVFTYNGTWNIVVETIFDGQEYNDILNAVFTIYENGQFNNWITGGGAWAGGRYYTARYIRVHRGDIVKLEKNSERNVSYTCLASIDTSNAPVFASGFTGRVNAASANVTISEDCYFCYLEHYLTENWVPSVVEINGIDFLETHGRVNKIDELTILFNSLSRTVSLLTENVSTLSNKVQQIEDVALTGFEEMVGEYIAQRDIPADWGNVVSGKYWNLVGGVAGLVSANNYFARPTLYQANGGQRMFVTVKNSIINELGAAAYACYDNDGLPADGNAARRNWGTAETIVDNGDGTSTYTFVLPANTSQVGLFYKQEPVTFYFVQNKEYNYSQAFDEHVSNVAGGGATTSGDSAKYYLKGLSPKSFPSEKKIAILAAGQSNIDGRVPYANMPSAIQNAQPITNCHYVKNSESGAFADLNITGNWAFDLVTYFNLCVTANKEIYVMKWSQGGTSIDPQGEGTNHWTADYEKLENINNSLLRKFETEIRNHIESSGSNFEIRAMLWHQGEADRAALGNGVAERYFSNLRNMISYIRGIVGNERLPIITGTISHNSIQYDATIEAAQIRLSQLDPYFYLIDMSGAPLLDNYHFNAASSVYLGEMAYNALIDFGVITGTKLNPTRPW